MSSVKFVEERPHSAKHNWPSNFFIEPDGTNVEAEFQAEKHAGHPWRQIIIRKMAPGRAKTYGSRVWRLTKDELIEWNARRVDVMLELVGQKIDDWDFICDNLLATGDEEMVEENWWHDNFWGDCTCHRCQNIDGQNWLGETWMHLRRQLQCHAARS